TEERAHEMLEGAALGVAGRHGGLVQVARAVPAVAHLALALEIGQHGPHGGVGRRIGQLAHHVTHGGPAQPVHDVHDLALAATKALVTGGWHGRQYANGLAGRQGQLTLLVSMRNPCTATRPNQIKSARTSSWVTTKGGSFCWGAATIRAGMRKNNWFTRTK